MGQLALKSAIDCNQPDIVDTIDKELVVIFDKILRYMPKSQSEAVQLCRFLVDQINGYDEDSKIRKRISDKIITLVQYAYQQGACDGIQT